ncbi:c-type cytochrome [Telluribacter sp. SYSU D00476]|uniref:c-type cytochrome n=1 Tax=Telluribacter sp. SYSU D00476 TaxID=2811430 RepID=UPI001FF5DD77|nr:c-type cytochrome [Telluribacter sp. SYSU D00476]
MKKKFALYLSLLGVASSILVACSQSKSQEGPKVISGNTHEQYTQDQVRRGDYLVTIMGCNDCHSSKRFGPKGPVPDPQRLLSGHPADLALEKVDTTLIGRWVLFNQHNTATVGPWGVSFAANLTPDPTGIGSWTEEQFFRAMREGKAKGIANNRDILPPMPWPMFSKLEDEDLKAIFAYLKSIPPVENVVPAPMRLKDISK